MKKELQYKTRPPFGSNWAFLGHYIGLVLLEKTENKLKLPAASLDHLTPSSTLNVDWEPGLDADSCP